MFELILITALNLLERKNIWRSLIKNIFVLTLQKHVDLDHAWNEVACVGWAYNRMKEEGLNDNQQKIVETWTMAMNPIFLQMTRNIISLLLK